MKIPIILAVLLFIFGAAASADTIHLNDGSSLEGKIVGFEGSQVKIATTEGILNVDQYKIKKIEHDDEEDEKIEEERAIGPGTPQWDSSWDSDWE